MSNFRWINRETTPAPERVQHSPGVLSWVGSHSSSSYCITIIG
ncbi:hypothetical protein [Escherichia coli IS29]|nr:hypothetical protein CSC07_1222 [Escherichia coli]CDK87550.1 hypothetical protein [Escherichia coli IS29]CDL06354.1 hypothetical protein [Escherichia coli IS35]